MLNYRVADPDPDLKDMNHFAGAGSGSGSELFSSDPGSGAGSQIK